jgi:integrase
MSTTPASNTTASHIPASAKPLSPLRRRMIEDMTVRGVAGKVQNDDIRHVKNFTIFLGRAPDGATSEDLRRFLLHQREQGVQPPTMNGAVSALRFFYTTTCDQPDMARHLRIVKQAQKRPVVLTTDEVFQLLEAARGWSASRRRGCSRARIGCCRSTRRMRWGSRSACRRTRCGTHLRRIFWSRARTFA